MDSRIINQILYDYCQFNKPEKVKKLLEEYHAEIDLVNQCELFEIVIGNDFKEVLDYLLQHYERTKLNATDKNTAKYKYAKYQITNIVQEAIDGYESSEISDEMKEIISKYIPDIRYDDYSSDEGDIEDVQLVNTEAMPIIYKVGEWIDSLNEGSTLDRVVTGDLMHTNDNIED